MTAVVVRAKTNLKYKIVKWKRRKPKNVLTDAEVKLTGYLSEKKYHMLRKWQR